MLKMRLLEMKLRSLKSKSELDESWTRHYCHAATVSLCSQFLHDYLKCIIWVVIDMVGQIN